MNRVFVYAFMYLAILFPCGGAIGAEALTLHGLFADNMILQRDIPLPVWGTSVAGDKVAVSFSGKTQEAVADKDGKWIVKLDPLKASSEAQAMTVSSSIGNQKLKIENVLVGDVWLCSG
ncbi:MAG: sialate O-acetylesterase, partial [Lentisphaerae bacterium]|nr:sialate O-acetylesterase [Lentisphaerota bacterium]